MTDLLKKTLALLVATVLLASGSAYALEPEESDNAGGGRDEGLTGEASGGNASGGNASGEGTQYSYRPFGIWFDSLSGFRVSIENVAEAKDSYRITDYVSYDEYIALKDALSDAVIGIDPGHQAEADDALEPSSPGSDCMKCRQSTGCTGVKSGVSEQRINLMVADKLSDLLTSCGATVYMTRDSGDASISNSERATMMNGLGVDLWIRIHCDSSSDPDKRGVSVLVPAYDSTPSIYASSLLLGNCVLSGFMDSTGAMSFGVAELSNQAGFNWSLRPVAAIELGFLSNARDDAKLNRESYQLKCAVGILTGISDYLELSESVGSNEADPEAEPSYQSGE